MKKIDFDTYLKSQDRVDFDSYMKAKGKEVINEFHIDSLKLFFACMNTKYKRSKLYSNLKTSEEWRKEIELHIAIMKNSDIKETFIGIQKLPHESKMNLLDDLFDKMRNDGELKRQKLNKKTK